MTIKISPKFEKHYRRLPSKIKEKARKKEFIFRENPFDARLKTHKLSGKDKNCWAFWIDDSYRIKFISLSVREVLFLDIGTHDIYFCGENPAYSGRKAAERTCPARSGIPRPDFVGAGRGS